MVIISAILRSEFDHFSNAPGLQRDFNIFMIFGFNSLRLLVCVFITMVLCIAVIASYCVVRTAAFSKIQPYQVQMMLIVQQDSTLRFEYDYGYGFNHQHQRQIDISADTNTQNIELSISAWKALRSLQISGLGEAVAELVSIKTIKGGRQLSLTKQQLAPMLTNGDLLIDSVTKRLEREL